MKEINSKNFEEKVLKAKKPVLIDFWAKWCGSCKILMPIIEELSIEMEKIVDIYKCNIEENPKMPTKYNIKSLPTLVLLQDGKVINTRFGASSKSAVKEWIEKNIIGKNEERS